MKINHEKAKARMSTLFIILALYIVILDPLIRWFYLPDTSLLSPWYFAILLPIINLFLYTVLFCVIYIFISVVLWILGIEETKDKE